MISKQRWRRKVPQMIAAVHAAQRTRAYSEWRDGTGKPSVATRTESVPLKVSIRIEERELPGAADEYRRPGDPIARPVWVVVVERSGRGVLAGRSENALAKRVAEESMQGAGLESKSRQSIRAGVLEHVRPLTHSEIANGV